jgi:uncharacterized C2H2 Zn-finger protein
MGLGRHVLTSHGLLKNREDQEQKR